MKNEYTPIEWANRKGVARKIRVRHSCGNKACHVFRCRDRAGYSCGRYRCQDDGGGDDNRCSSCLMDLKQNLPLALLKYLSTRVLPREDAICKYFGCYDKFAVIEDGLFDLVDRGLARWLGRNDSPLKYMITAAGRQELKRAT